MINIQKMMQQAQQVQVRLQQLQEDLARIDVQGESGGGLVRVVMTGSGMLKQVHIDTSLMTPSGDGMLEDLIVAAVNNANEAREARVKEDTRKLMEELGLPAGAAGGGLPF